MKTYGNMNETAVKIGLFAAVIGGLVAGGTGPALAGSTVNRVTEGYEDGYREVTVDSVRTTAGSYVDTTYNLKLDAVGEDAGVYIKYEDGEIYAEGYAENIVNPDPFVNIGEVETYEAGVFNETVETDVYEFVDFGSTYLEYRLDAFN